MEFHKAVELAKVYLGDDVTLRLSSNANHYERIAKLFSKLEIDFETEQKKHHNKGLNIGVGSDTNFMDLYIIVGLLKDLGLKYLYIHDSDYFYEECFDIYIGEMLDEDAMNPRPPHVRGIKPDVFFTLPFGSSREDYLKKVFGITNFEYHESQRDIGAYSYDVKYRDDSPRSSDHYNDNLDMDQQSPEFWDSI